MEERRENKKINFKGLIKWAVLVALVCYAVITMISQQSVIADQNARKQELLEYEAELTEQKDLLLNELDYVGTDSYAERVARDKLGWVKEGELIFKEKESTPLK